MFAGLTRDNTDKNMNESDRILFRFTAPTPKEIADIGRVLDEGKINQNGATEICRSIMKEKFNIFKNMCMEYKEQLCQKH